jgi:Flp pilus assembly protein TadD
MEQRDYLNALDAFFEITAQIQGFAQGYFGVASAAIELGLLDTAKLNLKHALDHGQDAVLLNSIGITFFKLEALNDAESAFKRSLDFDPNGIDILHNLAVTQTNLGKFSDAMKSISAAISNRPEDTALLMDFAKIALLAGHTSQAESTLEQLLNLDSTKQAEVEQLLAQHNLEKI